MPLTPMNFPYEFSLICKIQSLMRRVMPLTPIDYSWALKNNLKIHSSKTKEMLVVGRRSTRTQPPPNQSYQVPIERVEQLRVLGVLLNPQQLRHAIFGQFRP